MPDSPKIPFKNYLEDIQIKRKRGSDSIRFYNVRDYFLNLINKSGIKRRKIYEMLDVNRTTFNNWIGKSKKDVGIPIQYALTLLQMFGMGKDDILFKNVNIYYGCTNSNKYKLPTDMTPKLAYLIGQIMGDGHLSNPKDLISNGSLYNAEIRITKGEIKQLRLLTSIFYDIFHYKPPIFREKSFYRLVARSKVIHRFLHIVCAIPSGNKKNKTYIPDMIIKKDDFIKCFIGGFFDSDGCIVVKNKNIRVISMKQHNIKILLDIKHQLKKFGINISGIYKDRGVRNGTSTLNYVLNIGRDEEKQKFIKIIPSLKVMEVSRLYGKFSI